MCCVPATFSYSNFLRVRTECFANLFLKKDLCLYELVKPLKGCAFYSVRDYGPQKLLQNKLGISWRQQRAPCWGCEGGCCWSFSSQWPAFIPVLVPCSFLLLIFLQEAQQTEGLLNVTPRFSCPPPTLGWNSSWPTSQQFISCKLCCCSHTSLCRRISSETCFIW